MALNRFSGKEYSFIIGISSALGLRQLAMLLVMPIIAIYARGLQGSTSALIGLAVGVFGLTQAILQIPYGRWSDRVGRKPLVVAGLILLVLGLIIASMSKNIYILILGRALQGSGGIQAVSYAWIGDRICDENRNKAMSIAGIIVGICAVLGFLAGPLLSLSLTVPQLFCICALLVSVTCIYIIISIKEEKRECTLPAERKGMWLVLKDRRLLGLSFAGFLMNYVMIGMFFMVPQMLEGSMGISDLWKVFVPATIMGIIAMKIMIRYSEKDHFGSAGILAFMLNLSAGICLLIGSFAFICTAMGLFMMGYMYLSTILPSSVTRLAPKEDMGIAAGAFNTLQFLGSFIGGSLTGILWGINKSAAVSILILSSIAGIISMCIISTQLHFNQELEPKTDLQE